MLRLTAKKKIPIASALFSFLILLCALACGFCCNASHLGIDASGLPIDFGTEEVNDNKISELEINFYSLEDSTEEEGCGQNPANMGTQKDQNKTDTAASPK